jgi:hypothetical protein
MLRHGELISTMGTSDKVPSLNFQYTPEGSYPMLADSTGGKTRFIGGGPGNPSKNGVCNMCHNDKTVYTRPPIMGTPPETPINLTPLDGDATVDVAPLLTASAYYDPDAGDLHQASQWQISATPGDYSMPVYDSEASTDLTSHQVTAPLNHVTTYYWRVRYQNSSGAWSEYSAETSFATIPGSSGSTLIINPSDIMSNDGAYSISSGFTWATALDSDDGDMSYVYRCCSAPGLAFTMSMDDPAGLEGVSIESVTIHVMARYLDGPWPSAVPYAAVVDLGYRSSGATTLWSGSQMTDTSGGYALISSPTYTTDSDGGSLDLADLNNMSVTIKRATSGSPQLRITRAWAEVVYSY